MNQLQQCGEDWRSVFLETLANTSNVSASARKANKSTSTVYAARRADRKFRKEWRIALCEGYDQLEMELLQRLRSGQRPTAKTRYDNATALRILLAHRSEVSKERALQEHEDEDAILASLTRKLNLMREREAETRAQLVAQGKLTPDDDA